MKLNEINNIFNFYIKNIKLRNLEKRKFAIFSMNKNLILNKKRIN
jgi:hypothetical protein